MNRVASLEAEVVRRRARHAMEQRLTTAQRQIAELAKARDTSKIAKKAPAEKTDATDERKVDVEKNEATRKTDAIDEKEVVEKKAISVTPLVLVSNLVGKLRSVCCWTGPWASSKLVGKLRSPLSLLRLALAKLVGKLRIVVCWTGP